MGEHMVSLMKHSWTKGDTFHYCKVTVFKTEVVFEMFKLVGKDVWTIADSFVILGIEEE